jgi:hypothetical protein
MLPAHPQYHRFPKRLLTSAAIAGVVRSVPMDANEIVIHREQRDRMGVVLNLL